MLALSLSTAVLASCDKDEDKIIVTATPLQAPTASASSVAIDAEDLTATVLTLSWGNVTFTPSNVITTSDIVVSVNGQKPYVLAVDSPDAKTRAIKAKELNDILIDQFKLTPGVAQEVSFRVRTYPAKTSSTAEPFGSSLSQSEPVKVSVTPVLVLTETPNFYFVGEGIGPAKWNQNYNGYPFFKNESNAKDYTYIGLFKASAEFKIFAEDGLGDWANAYGVEGGKLLLNKGGNIKSVTAAGYYTVAINPSAGTFSVTPYTAGASATTYSKISIIGSSVGGWDNANDVLLEQSSYDPHIWTKTGVTLAKGELKFRADQKWNKNWGGAETTFPAALSVPNAPNNIQILEKNAGSYDVFFNDLTGHYLFRKK